MEQYYNRNPFHTRTEDELQIALKAIKEFEDEYNAMVTYGSLLGVLREKDFIAHDSDVS